MDSRVTLYVHLGYIVQVQDTTVPARVLRDEKVFPAATSPITIRVDRDRSRYEQRNYGDSDDSQAEAHSEAVLRSYHFP